MHDKFFNTRVSRLQLIAMSLIFLLFKVLASHTHLDEITSMDLMFLVCVFILFTAPTYKCWLFGYDKLPPATSGKKIINIHLMKYL